MKKELDVVAALIKKDGKFLLCQRREGDSFALLWEFHGGAVERNETFAAAIEREIKEELNLKVKAKELLGVFEDQNRVLKIKVYLFSSLIKQAGSPRAKDCKDFGFFSFNEIRKLKLAPVDGKIFQYFTKI